MGPKARGRWLAEGQTEEVVLILTTRIVIPRRAAQRRPYKSIYAIPILAGSPSLGGMVLTNLYAPRLP